MSASTGLSALVRIGGLDWSLVGLVSCDLDAILTGHRCGGTNAASRWVTSVISAAATAEGAPLPRALEY